MAAGHDQFHHVRDFPYFELPQGMKVELPSIAGFQLTKFMVLQVVAAVLVFLIFRGLSRRVADGRLPRGRFWNFWEMLALYIRDNVVRPTIGEGHHHDEEQHGHTDAHNHGHQAAATAAGHPADKYLPFVWSCFFYVLFCNLLGAVPWLGSATAEINVTAALALITMGAVIYYGSQEFGFRRFMMNLAPRMDVPRAMKIPLVVMIWLIELAGFGIKHAVLAVRLFANIMAGHTVIAVILTFIAATAGTGLYYVVLPSSILGQVAIGMLELFVAFLQAYIFAFLATLFIGMAVHAH